jgi:cytochrome c oxidase subunit 2
MLASMMLLVGCDGAQSSLVPAGRDAEQIANLFWWMAAGATTIWLAVVGLAVYSVRLTPGPSSRYASGLIIGGGALVPTVVLAVLLAYGLALIPEMLAPAPDGSLKITVTGEQWWWRVRYETSSGEQIALANEIRLPVGEPVEFHLESADVIHSFWIPSLGGKVDMFPGRQTRLKLEPTRTGVYRGACAEYCGTSHALMTFYVVVSEKEEFEHWIKRQSEPAHSPPEPLAVRGREVFVASGCGACHTLRGTTAKGVIGPDLTHVGGRMSLGAGILSNRADDFLDWLSHNETLKPEVHMPSFRMLPDDDRIALAAYLDALE